MKQKYPNGKFYWLNKIYWCPHGGECTIHQKTKSKEYDEYNTYEEIWYDFYCEEFGWFYFEKEKRYVKRDGFKEPCFSAPVPRLDKMSKEDREEFVKINKQ